MKKEQFSFQLIISFTFTKRMLVYRSLALLCMLLCVTAAPSSTSKDPRIQKIIDNDFLIYLTDKNYTNFLEKNSRPFNAFVFFSVIDKRFQCENCPVFESVMKQMAQAYKSVYTPETLTVFVITQFDHSRETFLNYQFEYVPQTLFLPKVDRITSKNRYSTKYSFPGPQYEIHAFYKFFNEHTHLDLRPSIPDAHLLLTLFIVVVVSVLISVLMPLGTTFIHATLNRYNWLLLVIFVYFCCIAGLPYDIIHDTSLYVYNPYYRRGGSPLLYTNPDPNNQYISFTSSNSKEFLHLYVLEGFSVALWCLAVSICFLLLLTSSTATKNFYQRHLYTLFLLLLAFTGVWELWKFYSSKARWIQGVLTHLDYLLSSIQQLIDPKKRAKLYRTCLKFLQKQLKSLRTLFK